MSLFSRPISLAFVMIAALAVFYLTQLHIGHLTRYDEFLTLDRSNGFLRFNDWSTVYAQNVPDFKKPPFQYWMGAALLSTGLEVPVALKIPSWFFAMLCLVGTVALARELAPHHPWAAPAAVLFLASSVQFWSHALSAMLETGSAEFVTFAILFTLKGLKNPAYWWALVPIVALGALQKTPLALIAALVVTLGALAGSKAQGAHLNGLRGWTILAAFACSACLVAAWPILQTLLHGYDAIRVGVESEMVDRFAPDQSSGWRGPSDIWRIVIRDEPFLRITAFVALLLLPVFLKDTRIWGLAALAYLYVLSIIVAGGVVYPRYTLNLLPMFCAATAILIFRAPTWTLRRKWLFAGAISILMLGPITPARLLGENKRGVVQDELTILPSVGAALQPEEMLVVCAFEGRQKLSPGAVSYYASQGRPFIYESGQPRMAMRLGDIGDQPVRGVCQEVGMALMEDLFDQIEIVEAGFPKGYVHFTASGNTLAN